MCDTNSKQSHKLRSHSMNEALASFLVSPCVKIIEKVSFNIASVANYVYILSGQKIIKNAKKWSILATFWKLDAFGQTVLPDRSVLIGQKLVEMPKFKKWDILNNFQIVC